MVDVSQVVDLGDESETQDEKSVEEQTDDRLEGLEKGDISVSFTIDRHFLMKVDRERLVGDGPIKSRSYIMRKLLYIGYEKYMTDQIGNELKEQS